jgi:hypothetical protein
LTFSHYLYHFSSLILLTWCSSVVHPFYSSFSINSYLLDIHQLSSSCPFFISIELFFLSNIRTLSISFRFPNFHGIIFLDIHTSSCNFFTLISVELSFYFAFPLYLYPFFFLFSLTCVFIWHSYISIHRPYYDLQYVFQLNYILIVIHTLSSFFLFCMSLEVFFTPCKCFPPSSTCKYLIY